MTLKLSAQKPLLKPALISLFIFSFIVVIGYFSTFALLKIELETDVASDVEVFWSDEKESFSPDNAKKIDTSIGRKAYWFLLDDLRKYSYLRLDPARQKSSIRLHEVTLYTLPFVPLEVDLLKHALEAHDLQASIFPSKVNTFTQFQALDNDPRILIRPVFSRSNIMTFCLLLGSIWLFSSKPYRLKIFLIFAGMTALYSFLTVNESTAKINVYSEQADQIKLFWRDKNESFSNTRIATIDVLPGDHQYQTKLGIFGNTEVIYLEKSAIDNSLTLNEIVVSEPGYQDFSFSVEESIVEKQGDMVSLFSSVLMFVLLVCLVVWLLNLWMAKSNGFYFRLFPVVIKIGLILAFYLIVQLAWQSQLNIHPDENAHAASVEYYSQYWDPPTVGDPRAEDAYQQPWGVSRLDDLGVSYFFAGKFRRLLQEVFDDEAFLARCFNIGLFFLFWVFSQNKRFVLFIGPLLCSPQIWYLFSYSNRGAFVLFISILLAWQLVYRKSSLNRFFNSSKVFQHVNRVIFPGLLLGVLSIEQTNYVLFLLFIVTFLAWKLLFVEQNKKPFFFKCCIFFLVGLSIFVARHAVDLAINGSNKSEQRLAYAEQHAGDLFKPSVASAQDSYSGLRLKDKGVAYDELFSPEWEWHKMVFKSLTGFYGYYAEYSPKWYYAYEILIFLIIFLLLSKTIIINAEWRYKVFGFFSLVAIFGGFLMSFMFCWLYDFQPQGRYMFPIIPIILVLVWNMFPFMKRGEKTILLTCFLVLSVLSFYSFNEVALNYLVS